MKYYPDTNEFSLKEFSLDYVSKIKHIFENLDEDNLEVVFNKLARAIESKKTIFTCGNGGSSSIAEHLVCDFVKGSSTDTNIDPKVFPLLNTPVITAIGNDIGYDDIFSIRSKNMLSQTMSFFAFQALETLQI